MKKTILIVLVFLWAIPPSASTAGSIELVVAAAANLQFTLDDLKAEFTKETRIDVQTVIGSSGQLTAQIENGAPFDVFLSADMKYPQTLYKEGLSVNAPKVYAKGLLVLWISKAEGFGSDKMIKILTDDKIKKVALANPQTAPYGRATVNVLKFYKIYSAVQPKLVYGESIAQVNAFIDSGAVDIGFTSESTVNHPPRFRQREWANWIEVPQEAYEPVAQGIVMLKYAQKKHLKAAQKFYDFIFSAPAQEIFQKYGYKLP